VVAAGALVAAGGAAVGAAPPQAMVSATSRMSAPTTKARLELCFTLSLP
jgi:hypothetical protein